MRLCLFVYTWSLLILYAFFAFNIIDLWLIPGKGSRYIEYCYSGCIKLLFGL